MAKKERGERGESGSLCLHDRSLAVVGSREGIYAPICSNERSFMADDGKKNSIFCHFVKIFPWKAVISTKYVTEMDLVDVWE